MKKEVCVVLCAVGLAACGGRTETPQTPEMRTQTPTEAWSMPGAETEENTDRMPPGTSAPGSVDRDFEPPSTEGTGDEGFVVPQDPAIDGTLDPSGVQRPGNTNTGPGVPGTNPSTTPGVPGGTPPGGAVPPGATPPPGGVNPGTTPGGTNRGTGTPPTTTPSTP